MPPSPREVVRSALPSLPSTAVTSRAVARLRRRPPIDPSGWTTREFTAYLAAGKRGVKPPLRAGHRAVQLTNSLDGTLPTDAVLLARAVADAAPPLGQEVGATLAQIVDRYLPDTLLAYRDSGQAMSTPEGHRLIVEQLHLLHQVTHDVLRADAEHDDRGLRLQERFLKERFARVSNQLDLTPPKDRAPWRAEGSSGAAQGPPSGPRALAASQATTHHRLEAEHGSSAVLTRDQAEGETLRVRLALPPGVPVTLGAVVEQSSGAIGFVNGRARRWQARRRQRGFGVPQLDIEIALPLVDLRRFVLHARTSGRGEAVDAVLFLAVGDEVAQLPARLLRRPEAATTLLASGHDTSEGLFVRNESRVYPTVRALCEAFDYRRVTWLSADTPVV